MGSHISRLAIHQATILPQWTLSEAIAGCSRQGIRQIGVWREKLAELGIPEAVRQLADHGMSVSGVSPVGSLGHVDDVLRALDEAASIGAPCIVFLAGPVDPHDKDIATARSRALERLEKLIPHARSHGVMIGLEPMNPMYAATRSVLTDLKMANDWCDALAAPDVVGIVVDTYHVWPDPRLGVEIRRAGARICGFHVADWLVDTQDLRLDRGMIGDGVIPIASIMKMVEEAGYRGPIEAEIFSARNWWKRDPNEVVRTVKERYAAELSRAGLT